MADPSAPHSADRRPVIAFVTNSLPPYQLHFHRRLARELLEFRVVIYATHRERERNWSTNPDTGVEYVDLSGGDPIPSSRRGFFALREWRRGGKLIGCLRQLRPAAVVVHGYYDLCRMRLLRSSIARRVPTFIFGDSNLRSDRNRSPLQISVKRRVIGALTKYAAGCLVFGSNGRKFFEFYGVPPDKIFYMPCEPDYEQIESITTSEVDQARAQFGIDSSLKWMVYSGRLAPVKRVDLLLKAFEQLATERPDWGVIILGDGLLRAELEGLVPGHLKSRVRWLGFLPDQHLVSKVYHACDLLVLPSDHEPWALVVNEAGAAGLALVVTDVVGAAPELVRDGVNGRVVPAGDLGSLVGALRDATEAGTIQRYRRASPGIVREWREEGDPIMGLRRALQSAGVAVAQGAGSGGS